jgi:hypothetical protein
MKTAAALLAVLALSACAQSAIYKDPATGQVQQCTSNIPPTLPALAQADIDKCGKVFEGMGWKKQ